MKVDQPKTCMLPVKCTAKYRFSLELDELTMCIRRFSNMTEIYMLFRESGGYLVQVWDDGETKVSMIKLELEEIKPTHGETNR